MNNFIEVITIVEGKTEEIFVNSLLQPYLAEKMVFMTATQVSKPGQKGGDVRFERVKKDLEIHLKQRTDTYVTTLVDFYGVRDWPGIDLVPTNAPPAKIAEIINGATLATVVELFAEQGADQRFIRVNVRWPAGCFQRRKMVVSRKKQTTQGDYREKTHKKTVCHR